MIRDDDSADLTAVEMVVLKAEWRAGVKDISKAVCSVDDLAVGLDVHLADQRAASKAVQRAVC